MPATKLQPQDNAVSAKEHLHGLDQLLLLLEKGGPNLVPEYLQRIDHGEAPNEILADLEQRIRKLFTDNRASSVNNAQPLPSGSPPPSRILDTGGWGRGLGGGAPKALVAPLLDCLWRYLESVPRGHRELVRLSLTCPGGSGEAFVDDAGHLLAREAAHLDGSLFLALDISGSGAPHLYGLSLADEGVAARLVEFWNEKTRAVPSPDERKRVSGQKFEWIRAKNYCLDQNLSKVLGYALKPLPPQFDRPLQGRVIASGAFEQIWQATLASNLPSRTSREVSITRNCQHCGGAIENRRSDAKYCNDSHKTLACLERKKQRDTKNKKNLTRSSDSLAVDRYLGSRCPGSRGTVVSALKAIAKLAGFDDPHRCPWSSFSEVQISELKRKILEQYSTATAKIYSGIFRRVVYLSILLRVRGEDAEPTPAGEGGSP